jgi:large subunit ribosomal protein L32
MAVPKRKKSKMKKRQMKAGRPYKGVQATYCVSCGNPVAPHRVCPSCATYKGRQIISRRSDK